MEKESFKTSEQLAAASNLIDDLRQHANRCSQLIDASARIQRKPLFGGRIALGYQKYRLQYQTDEGAIQTTEDTQVYTEFNIDSKVTDLIPDRQEQTAASVMLSAGVF